MPQKSLVQRHLKSDNVVLAAGRCVDSITQDWFRFRRCEMICVVMYDIMCVIETQKSPNLCGSSQGDKLEMKKCVPACVYRGRGLEIIWWLNNFA